MSALTDRIFVEQLGNANGQALTNHILSLGASESTTEGQMVKALAQLALLPQVPLVQDATAHMTIKLAHLRDPKTNRGDNDR
jgi:hypothetical protein